MNPTGHPFRFNIGFLINQPIGYTREIPFEFKDFLLEEDLITEDLSGVLVLNRTVTGLRLDASFEAFTLSECARCLEEIRLPINTQFEEIFTFDNHPLSEDELIIPEDGNVDFAPYIRDYLFLEIPIRPLCKPDCLGLCDVCGENLNLQNCGHDQQKDELNLPGGTIAQRIQSKKNATSL